MSGPRIKRYIVVTAVSNHCCFDWAVVDTFTKSEMMGMENEPHMVCETFKKSDALKVSDALNDQHWAGKERPPGRPKKLKPRGKG